MLSSMKREEHLESVFFGIFRVKLVAKNMSLSEEAYERSEATS